MIKKKLVLASSSPRRKKLLKQMGLEFEVVYPDYEEIIENAEFSYEKIEKIAYNKAKSVLKMLSSNNNHLILSADTVVILDGKILGKPLNQQDAIKMLKNLSGKKHSVVTSICVINPNNTQCKISSETSFVKFKNLTKKLITDYITKYNPLDKAGSYGIQELPDGFIDTIEGSFENIIGLCPKSIIKILDEVN